jgi:hypothetical protein
VNYSPLMVESKEEALVKIFGEEVQPRWWRWWWRGGGSSRAASATTKECGGPRRAAVPWPPSSLEMVLVWRCHSSSLAASKGRQIRSYGLRLKKIGFPVNI